ncbi:tribbles homolog 1 [Protopterus annectens]|uniref:tribbles homolog 1 n=1 Tax=Protopterus annectens TaxID=7888 RepID=UPI001CFA0F06|nr:tribbles homolog 1 [Protopterus annectens]
MTSEQTCTPSVDIVLQSRASVACQSPPYLVSMSLNVQQRCPSLLNGRYRPKRLDPCEMTVTPKRPRLSEPAPDSRSNLSSTGLPSPLAPGGDCTSNLQGPTALGTYLLLPLAGRENVFQALHLHTGTEMLCKVFNIKHYQDKIKPYLQLPPHRNISRIVEVILGDQKAYVFFEKVWGDMHSYVKSCKKLTEEESARLFHQIVSAVAHCHQRGIVVGDLKLRKFVFCDEQRTHVRLENLEDTHIMKGEDDSLSDKHGCPAYVSPEILNTTGSYSGKSADVWSLGVMLYTLLVGRYPFHDSDPSTLFTKIRRGQYCIPDEISPKAKCLIRSLLRKDPSERLTASEILLHQWFHAVLEPGYLDKEIKNCDQTVPDIQIDDFDMSCFFC